MKHTLFALAALILVLEFTPGAMAADVEEIRAAVEQAQREAQQSFKSMGAYRDIVMAGITLAGEVAESGEQISAEAICQKHINEAAITNASLQGTVTVNGAVMTKTIGFCTMGFKYTMALINR